ncbi:MAG: OsmC family protein [Alphaproteobacteria bacterium]|nr:MAG: OsmC family protein [Alphaproteobacteria bacterium]
MISEKVSFPGHAGDTLDARLDRPRGPHLATALFAHCFTCGKSIAAARRISQRLAEMGIAVLRFDFTGLGHSEGEFANTNFTSNVADLIAAARYLEERRMAPALLVGHSLGGAAVLAAAGDIPSVRAVATIGAPIDPGHVAHNFAADIARIRERGEAEVHLGGRPFVIRKSFLDDIAAQNLEPRIRNLRAALLVMHAPRDEVVGIENATRIFLAARHPKSFVTLDDADHLLTRPEDADYAADVIAAWSSRYLSLKPPAPPPGAPEGVVRVTEADPNGFLQDIQFGPHHHIVADEPVAYGGTNRGPSPYGLLAAALGACTSMTMRMYARRKRWPVEGIEVDVFHHKVHAQDAAGNEGGKAADEFVRAIRLVGPLSPEQRQRLLEIANRCPVHRTLEAGARVVTVAVRPEEAPESGTGAA